MWNLILNAFIKYIESHPAVIEDLIDKAVTALIAHLDAQVKK